MESGLYYVSSVIFKWDGWTSVGVVSVKKSGYVEGKLGDLVRNEGLGSGDKLMR